MADAAASRPRQPRLPIEVRREQALDAALVLISETGYHSLTMEAVARRAGLAKPVLYNAYPGIAPLLRALLDREQMRGLQALAAAMPPHLPNEAPGSLLMKWFTTLAQVIASNPQPWRLMLTPPGETPAAVRDRIEEGRRLASAQVRTLVARLLADRGLELDPDLTAELVLAAAEQAANLLIRDPASYPPERLIEYAASVLGALRITP
jgi:AcrR family transcriptional regulator